MSDQRIVLLHFAEEGDTSGYFPQLGRWHDHARYKMIFATLRPMAPAVRASMEERGIECFSCRCTSRTQYGLGILRLMKFLRRRRVQILHTHLFDPSVVGLIAGRLARTPVRVVTRHYSDYHTRDGKKWHTRLDQMCTALSQRAIAVSQHTADVMLQEEGAPPDKVTVVLNGVDFDRLKLSSPDAPQKIRDEFAPNGEILLLQMARLHPEKGHEYLFRALPQIRAQAPRPVRLLLAGRGPFEEQYRALVRELGIEDMVTFLGFRRDGADLMAAADAMILPSVAEAFGLVLTEAIYIGTPVVASRAGGMPEIVDDGVDGLLVPPASAEALAGAIIRVISDDALRQKLAGAGREKVLAQFGFERMVQQYEEVYSELL